MLHLFIDNDKNNKYLKKLSNFNKFTFINNNVVKNELKPRHRVNDFIFS